MGGGCGAGSQRTLWNLLDKPKNLGMVLVERTVCLEVSRYMEKFTLREQWMVWHAGGTILENGKRRAGMEKYTKANLGTVW